MNKLPKRLQEKITITDNGCWQWTGSIGLKGYGLTSYKDISYSAHKFIYQLLKGEVPAGLVLDHLCRNRSCVNPKHLEIVTQQVNLLRGKTKAAENAAKRECIKGHKYTDENTYVKPNGARNCKICQRIRVMNYQRKRGYSLA